MIHGWIPEQEMGGEYQPETLRLIGKAVADCKTREQVFSTRFLLFPLFVKKSLREKIRWFITWKDIFCQCSGNYPGA